MSLIVGLVAAAVAGIGGALVARVLVKRKRASKAVAALPAPEEAEAPAPDDERLSIGIGDVIQHGDATRWPRCQLLARHGSSAHCALLLSVEGGVQQATVVFAPPKRDLLWLEQVSLSLPPSPPSRLEIRGQLLDRQQLLHVAFTASGEDPPAVTADGTLAFYEGVVGDAAVVLIGTDQPCVYYGPRLRDGDYEALGQVGHDGSDV